MGNEHHFVSQFYLRRFSQDEKSVHLLNLRSGHTILHASIAGQCKKRGLYNFNSNVEGALADLEGSVAAILRTVDRDSKLPPQDSPEEFALKYFILLQKVRTVGAGRAANEAADFWAKQYYSNELAEAGVEVANFRIREKYPNAIPMKIVSESAHMLADFDLHLYLNATLSEFVTSDNPAVAHNMYCEGISTRGVLGFGCAGFQVIFPISADKCVMMYDRDVYSVGKIRSSRLTSLDDVHIINAFQILNAENNIYFRSEKVGLSITAHAEKLSKKRAEKRLVFVTTNPVSKPDGSTSSIVHHYERLLPLRLSLSCLSIRRRKRSVPLFERALSNKPSRDRSGPSDYYTVKDVEER